MNHQTIEFIAAGATADEMDADATREAARYFGDHPYSFEITAVATSTRDGTVLMYEGTVRAWMRRDARAG